MSGNHEDRRAKLILGVGLLGSAAALTVLYAISRQNYLFVHTLMELASVIVACGVFAVFWNTRQYVQNGYFLFLGVAWVFVAAIDMVHTMAYEGMQIIGDGTAELPTQLWIVARYLEACSLLVATLFVRRRVDVGVWLAVYAILFTAALASIFGGVFPSCYSESGLTAFKVASEYVICLILLAGIGLLWRRRREFDPRVLRLMIGASSVTIVAELCFTWYVNTYGVCNFLGHAFKVVAFYLVYKAMIEVSLRQPYSVLFREVERQAERADAANLAKSQFLAGMSHELRTPMNAIIGMTGQALDEPLSPDVRDCLETVRTAAEALHSLLNEILDFSRIEAGKMEVETIPFGLRQLVDHTLKVLSVRAKEKGLSLECAICSDVPDALAGDPLRLRQVLTNLLGNAVKFTPRGWIRLRIAVAEARGSGLQSAGPGQVGLTFSVSDSGIGIAQEHLAHIFQPFTQADASTTRRFGGTGLGLAITDELIKAMGGCLGVQSELGKGSTFQFTLRFSLSQQEGVAGPASHGEVPPPAHPLRILLVEDTPANQKLIRRILAKRGHAVELAENGHEAVACVRKERYDVVLMDVQMPGMDGFEATRAIRSLDIPWSQLPIIAMTAHALKGDRERCLEQGMDDYLAKPIEAAALVRQVEARGKGE